MIIMALVGGMAWATDPCPCTGTLVGNETGPGITGIWASSRHWHAPVGCYIPLAVAFYDYDVTTTGTTPDTVNPTISAPGWTVIETSNSIPCYKRYSLTKTGTETGTDTLVMNASDNANCGSLGKDPDVEDRNTFDWVGITAITGTSTAYAGDCPKLSVDVGPAVHDNDTATAHIGLVKWYYSNYGETTLYPLTGVTSDTVHGRSVCTVSLPEGKYTITARVETNNGLGSLTGTPKTHDIIFNAIPQEKSQCKTSSSKAGCPTCSTANSVPNISITDPVVQPPDTNYYGLDTNPTESKCKTAPSIKIIKKCDQLEWRCSTCEGANQSISFPQSTTATPAPADPYNVALGNGYTAQRIGSPSGTSWSYKLIYPDNTVYSFGGGPSSSDSERITIPKIQRADYPTGAYTTYTYNQNGTGSIDSYSPTGVLINSTGFVTDSNNRVTTIINPDGSQSTTIYPDDTWENNKPTTIIHKDRDNNELSRDEYAYTDGRLVEISRDNKVTSYSYETDSSSNVTAITETNASGSAQTTTRYDYGSTTTTVTQKHPTDSSKDQTTLTEFFMHSGKKTYIWKVTDPYGKTTTYGVYVPTGTAVTGKTVNEDYIISDDPDLVGKVFKVTDSNGNETEYAYNAATGTISSVTYPDSTTTTLTYYNDSQGNPTIFTRTMKDRQGNYAHSVRSTSSLYQVDKVKISPPINGQEPTDWSTITADTEYDYYPSSDSHGQGESFGKSVFPMLMELNPKK
jgi:hypothetical protein